MLVRTTRMLGVVALIASTLDPITGYEHRTPCSRNYEAASKSRSALGHMFHGEGQQKGFPLEDEYVFVHYFSQHGSPPYHTNGTFLELGAHDGVAVSNTLWLEQALGWRGVLVEASEGSFKSLRRHRRTVRNTLRNAAVCPQGQTVNCIEPKKVSDSVMAGMVASMPEGNRHYLPNRHGTLRKLECTPLSTILQEAGVYHVDFFSLDVEGAELIVLETIDWSAVTFDVLMVELDGKNATKDVKVRQLLRAKGFSFDGVTGSFCRAEIWIGHSRGENVTRDFAA
jgi:FkbM family methyltransferase